MKKWLRAQPDEPRTLLLIQDLHVRIVNAATGEILRELDHRPRLRLPRHRTTTRARTEKQ